MFSFDIFKKLINLHLKILINPRTTKTPEQTTCPWYRTRLQTKKIVEESDAKIERLEKASQDQQGQMAKMMEMLRTLVKDIAQVVGQQNSVAHPE